MNASGAISIGDIFATLTLEDSFSGKLQIAAGQLDAIGKKWMQVGNKLSETGNALLPLSAGMAAAGAASLITGGQFESTLTKMSTLAGVSAADLANVKERILDLAPKVGQGPNALADAMMVVSSTLEDTKVGLTVLETAARASASGLGDAKDVAKALTSIINSYGAENITAARAGDILTATVKAGGAEANEMAGVLGRVVPIAAQMGVKFEEVGAFLATFTKLGVDASEAVTALRGVFTTMLSPTQDAEKAMRDVGLSAAGLRKSIREDGLTDSMIGLLQAFKGNETAAAAVFGNVRALAGIMGTAGQQAGTYRDVLRQVTDSAGLLDAAFDKIQKTQVQTWNQLTALVGVVAVRFGDALAPAFKSALEAVRPLLEGIVSMAQAFATLPQPVQTAAIAVAAMMAAAAPLALALSSIVKVAAVVASGVSFLTGLFVADAAAVTTDTAATLANTAAKAANAAAAAAAAATSGGYTAATLASSFAMQEAAIAARRSMTSLVPLSTALAETGAAAAATSTGVAASVTSFSLMGTIVAALPAALTALAAAAVLGKEGISALGSIAQSTGSMLSSFAKQSAGAAESALIAAGNAATSFGSALLGSAPGVGAFGDAVGGLRGKLSDAAAGMQEFADQAAKGNWSGLANAIRPTMPVLAGLLDAFTASGAAAANAAGQVMQYQTAEQAAAAAATHGDWVLSNRANKLGEISKAFDAYAKQTEAATVRMTQVQKDALDKLNNREVTDWAVDLAGALSKVNTVAGMTLTAQIELGETMEEAIAVYAAAGKAIPAEMVKIAEQARAMSGTVSKAQEAINEQVRGYTALVIKHSGSARDAQLADIAEWERSQIEAAKAAGTYSSAWYDAMKRQSAEMTRGVLVDFDSINSSGTQAGKVLREAAERAQETLEYMSGEGAKYTATDIAQARERRDIAREAWNAFRAGGTAALTAVKDNAEHLHAAFKAFVPLFRQFEPITRTLDSLTEAEFQRLGGEDRIRQIENLYRMFPGRKSGGYGATGVLANDAAGFGEMNSERIIYQQLMDYIRTRGSGQSPLAPPTMSWGSQGSQGVAAASAGAAAAATTLLAGVAGAPVTNNFYVNGTAEDVARKISDIFTKQMYLGRQWPSLG